MLNLASIMEMGSSPYGKTAYSILAGTVGAVILMAFLNTLVVPVASVRFLPLIIAFNTALTGYMVIEKTRTSFQHRWSVAVGAGIAAAGLVFVALSFFFFTDNRAAPDHPASTSGRSGNFCRRQLVRRSPGHQLSKPELRTVRGYTILILLTSLGGK